jgi:signal transduction histidine kinase
MGSRELAPLLESLRAVSRRIAGATDFAALLEAVVASVADVVPSRTAAVLLLDPSGESLIVRAATERASVGTRIPRDDGAAWSVLDRREPRARDGLLHVPLVSGASILGVLEVRSEGASFADEQMTALRILGDQAASAIERAELYANLQHFTEQLMSADEEQRRRLARDLHDGIAPILVSAYQNLQLHYAHTPTERRDERLEKSVAHLRKAIQETRGLIAGLRPATLDDLGLAGALSAEAHEMAKDAGWELVREVEDLGPLSLEAEATLFRVLHEALENARAHAGAHRVRFQLKGSGEDLVAVVADDGRGFLTTDWLEAGTGHFGLLGMRERIALLGGECRITSRPGAGTEVRIRVPLKRLRG